MSVDDEATDVRRVLAEMLDMTPDDIAVNLGAIPRILDALEGPEWTHLDGKVTRLTEDGLMDRTDRIEMKVDRLNGGTRLEPKERGMIYVAGVTGAALIIKAVVELLGT